MNKSPGTMPSTGFYMITNALTLCNKLNVFGFWPFPKTVDGRTNSYHYFNNVTGNWRHNFTLEMKWIATMHRYGLLQLHMGNCMN